MDTAYKELVEDARRYHSLGSDLPRGRVCFEDPRVLRYHDFCEGAAEKYHQLTSGDPRKLEVLMDAVFGVIGNLQGVYESKMKNILEILRDPVRRLARLEENLTSTVDGSGAVPAQEEVKSSSSLSGTDSAAPSGSKGK